VSKSNIYNKLRLRASGDRVDVRDRTFGDGVDIGDRTCGYGADVSDRFRLFLKLLKTLI
jgi:hypothetical protein